LKTLLTVLLLCLASSVLAAPARTKGRPKNPDDVRLEPKAGLPEQTAHFTVEAYGTRAPKTVQLVESVFSDFLDITGIYNFYMPKKIRVVVFENEREFRAKTNGGRSRIVVAEDLVATYEQEKVERLLTIGLASVLFDKYIGHKPASEERWLRRGIVECVVFRRAGTSFDELRERWRSHLKKDGPGSLPQILGKEQEDENEAGTAVGGTKRRGGNLQRRLQLSSASLVAFLGSWGGKLNFSFLLSELRDGRSLDQAVAKAYAGKFRNFEELYNYWLVNEVGSLTPKPVDAGSAFPNPKTPGRTRR
jgi:hypothetical protein